MATLNAGSEKPLGLFCFGCFRLQNTVPMQVQAVDMYGALHTDLAKSETT